jgi:serine/threonine-protein kinase
MSAANGQQNDVQAQIDRVVKSKGFARSERLAAFLRFIVERSLDGRTGELKETSIGVEVYGRPADYDPKQDSIVRTEAVKLRTRLADYYRGEGASDAVVIELPKGGYAPTIHSRATPAMVSLRIRWLVATGLAAMVAGLFAWWWIAPSAASFSIAVLPFANMTGDSENDYLSDGLTEEITDRLANTHLKVIARTTSSILRAKGYTVHEIGQKLKVGTVLEGSVRKEGNHVKVAAQLIRVSDETHILSRTFDRDMSNVFGLQTEVAAAIVQTLQPKLSNRSRGLPGQHAPNDPEAYKLYLKGRYFLARDRAASMKQSIEYFEQAITTDPRYARAYAGLSSAYIRTAFFQGLPPIQLYPKAKSMAVKALDLDQENAEAHAAFGILSWDFDRDKRGAEKEFQRALALDPESEETLVAYGNFLRSIGRLEEANEKYKRAESLSPLSLAVSQALANADYLAGRYDAAIERCRKMQEMDQAFWRARQILGMAYLGKRMYAEAIQAFQTLPVDRPGPQPSLLAYAYAVSGQKVEAERILHDWENFSRHGHVPAASVAMIYTGLGEKARALDWLEAAYQERDVHQVLLNPQWDSLRSEPRFLALLKEMRLKD